MIHIVNEPDITIEIQLQRKCDCSIHRKVQVTDLLIIIITFDLINKDLYVYFMLYIVQSRVFCSCQPLTLVKVSKSKKLNMEILNK